MPFIIKYFFSFIFLCGIFSSSLAAFPKGDSLYVKGHYFEASVEYERQLFESTDNSAVYALRYKKALCYKKLRNFDRSVDELQSIFFANVTDSLFQRVFYELSLCYYLNGEPFKALGKIEEYFHRSTDSTTFQVFMPLKIRCLNETQQWDRAKENFDQYVKMQNFAPDKETEILEIVNALYSKPNLPRLRSAEKAENWSRFVPGAGQIYAGKTGEGVLNLLINSSIIAFAGHQFIHKYYITGYLAGLGFFNKTYHGGMKRAATLASQKNKELLIHFNSQVNSVILDNFDL